MLMYNVINQNYLAKRYLTLLLMVKSAAPLTHTHKWWTAEEMICQCTIDIFKSFPGFLQTTVMGLGNVSQLVDYSPSMHKALSSIPRHNTNGLWRHSGEVEARLFSFYIGRVAWATWRPLIKQTNKQSDLFSGLHWCCSCPAKWHPDQTTQEWYLRLTFILTSLKL